MDGFYLWISFNKLGNHKLDKAKKVELIGRKIKTFDDREEFDINESQLKYGFLGAYLGKEKPHD